MMLSDARALAKYLTAAHTDSDFYDVLRNRRGYSMMVVTDVTPETIIRWFAQQDMIVTKVEARGRETWRVWFQEMESIKE